MRKVIGIGETILDIIFENNQPQRAVPGGSVFNAMVSLSRLGVPVSFISELGDDKVSDIVCDFMCENNMTTDYMNRFAKRRSAISLAFLGSDKSASYIFHKDFPEERLTGKFPEINEDDILLFGSFYALDPQFRDKFIAFVRYAAERKALIYYDPNFRPSHNIDKAFVYRAIAENCDCATIVRGSDEDFQYLYGSNNMTEIYENTIKQHCTCFLTTHGADGVNLYTENLNVHFDSKKIEPVSTIGAGDNFNAGIAYGLIKYNVRRSDIPTLSADDWKEIIECGIELSAEVCMSYDNYISKRK